MLALAVLVLNNNSVGLHKLWALTNPTSNAWWFFSTAVLTLKGRSLAPALAFPSSAPASMLMPLSNTMFMMHPTLLAASLTLAASSGFRSLPHSAWAPPTILAFSMFLGGFWSTQELNWGGWWNWDVLEMGSLIVWLLVTAHSHNCGSSRATVSAWLGVSTTMASFYLLNKSGLGVSMHSFVVSNTLRTNYISLMTALVVLAVQSVTFSLVLAGACSLCYLQAASLSAAKQAILAVAPMYLLGSPSPRLTHSALMLTAVGVSLFNYHNAPVTSAFILWPATSFLHYDYTLRMSWAEPGSLVHSSGWRAKPASTYFQTLASRQQSSSSLKLRVVAYAK